MGLNGLNIGFALTGSFCTLKESLNVLKTLKSEGATLTPIVSFSTASLDTRFIKAHELIRQVEEICGSKILSTITETEPIGPKVLLDVLVVSPCTGNTLAKISNAITDTPVTMAVKAHLRNERPVVIAVSTNDGLGANAKNIGLLLNMKNIYFVPFYQDDPIGKGRSLLARHSLTSDTINLAIKGKQIQPILSAVEPRAT